MQQQQQQGQQQVQGHLDLVNSSPKSNPKSKSKSKSNPSLVLRELKNEADERLFQSQRLTDKLTKENVPMLFSYEDDDDDGDAENGNGNENENKNKNKNGNEMVMEDDEDERTEKGSFERNEVEREKLRSLRNAYIAVEARKEFWEMIQELNTPAKIKAHLNKASAGTEDKFLGNFNGDLSQVHEFDEILDRFFQEISKRKQAIHTSAALAVDGIAEYEASRQELLRAMTATKKSKARLEDTEVELLATMDHGPGDIGEHMEQKGEEEEEEDKMIHALEKRAQTLEQEEKELEKELEDIESEEISRKESVERLRQHEQRVKSTEGSRRDEVDMMLQWTQELKCAVGKLSGFQVTDMSDTRITVEMQSGSRARKVPTNEDSREAGEEFGEGERGNRNKYRIYLEFDPESAAMKNVTIEPRTYTDVCEREALRQADQHLDPLRTLRELRICAESRAAIEASLSVLERKRIVHVYDPMTRHLQLTLPHNVSASLYIPVDYLPMSDLKIDSAVGSGWNKQELDAIVKRVNLLRLQEITEVVDVFIAKLNLAGAA